jgi:hypothetical protein
MRMNSKADLLGKEANWLPAPKDKFILMLRLYWPYEPPQLSILDGSWKAAGGEDGAVR